MSQFIDRWLSAYRCEMWELARELYRRMTDRLGVRPRLEPIEKLHPVDVREVTDHWSTFLYHVDMQPVVVDAPVWRSVDIGGLCLGRDGAHPCVQAMLRGRHSHHPKLAMRRLLFAYYDFLETRDAVDPLAAPHANASIPKATSDDVFPWAPSQSDGPSSPETPEVVKRIERLVSRVTPGDHRSMVSETDIERQVDRFEDLLETFRSSNTRSSGAPGPPIDAIGLVDDRDDWRWMPAGERDQSWRVAASSAFGYDRLPIRVHRIVVRDHAPHWPGVLDGEYSRSEALALFDRLFYQIPTHVMRAWSEIDR